MLARLDLGAQYGNTPVLLGTAVDLRAWEGIGSAATRHGRPPERGRPRGQEAERRTVACWHCGGRHHVRDCEDVSETMRVRLLTLHRNGGIRRDNRGDPGGGAAGASARSTFGDMSMSESSGEERKSGDGNQRLESGRGAAAVRKNIRCYICSGPHLRRHCNQRWDGAGPSVGVSVNREEAATDHVVPTEPEMPAPTEDPLPRGGGDPRQDEEAGAEGAPTQRGQRYLGWTPQGGHMHERPMEVRGATSTARALDTTAAPWQPPLPSAGPRQTTSPPSMWWLSPSDTRDQRRGTGDLGTSSGVDSADDGERARSSSGAEEKLSLKE